MSENTVQAVGARASIAIGEESNWGTAVDPTHKIAFLSESFSAEEDTIQSEAIRGDRGVYDLIAGTLDVSGDLSYEQAASGFGMVIRHVLGDYIKAQGCDGGVHGRMEVDNLVVASGHVGDPRVILPLAKEHSGGFKEAGGSFAVVDRGGANNSLRFDNDSGDTDTDGVLGHPFDEYTPSEFTHVHSVNASDLDPADGTTSIASITLYPITLPDGSYAVPDVSSIGGYFEVGPNRDKMRYVATAATTVTIDSVSVDTVKLFIDTADFAPGATSPPITAGDACFTYACLVHTSVGATDFPTSPPITKGAWVYEYEETQYSSVYTHHIERGRYLPEGLTIEIDRDAAVFLYSGMKGSSITWTFDSNAIVNASASFSGQRELAMATLVEDVLPGTSADGNPLNGSGYILVENADAFPDPNTRADMDAAMITIGERTGIYYNQKVLAGAGDGLGYSAEDEVYKLVLSDDAGVADASLVDRFAPAGSNVDCRTPRRLGNAFEADDAPLTSFESMVYVDGYYEEVLSGEVTLENNLNGDKYGLGSRNRLAVVAEQADVSASLTMEFDDGKHYNRFRNTDYFYLEFKSISEADGAEIGTSGILPQQYVILPKCKFNGDTPQVGDRSFIEHDMPITGVVDREYDTKDLVCILVNGVSKDVEGTP